MKIAVASGKGGTGKTFVSTHLFAAWKEAGERAVLVDCDAEVPDSGLFIHPPSELRKEETRLFCPSIDRDACSFCGCCSEACHFNAIACIASARYVKVLPDLCHGCGACLALCPQEAVRSGWKKVGTVSVQGTAGIPELVEARMAEGERSPVPVIRQAIRMAEESGARHLVLDAPPGCSCPFVNTVLEADLVILVSEPTPFGLSDLQHSVTVLRQLDKPFQVIINRCDVGDGRLREWLDQEGIPLLAEIPYSREIASCYSAGRLAAREIPWLQVVFRDMIKKIRDEVGSYQR